MKFRIVLTCLALVIAFAVAVPALAEMTPEQIAQKSLDREKGKNKVSNVEMAISRGSSKKVRIFAQLTKQTPKGSKKLAIFSDPPQMKGTGFLSWENKGRDDDQWLYMSSRKQVRRIASSDKTSSFMGSDLSYEDMGEQQASDRTHEMIEETTLNGRKCWVIESTIKPGIKSGYEKAKSWIDQETFISLKLEAFDKNGNLIKTMETIEHKEVDGVWTVTKLKVTPEDGKTSTTLTIKDIKYGGDLADSKFNKDNLKNN